MTVKDNETPAGESEKPAEVKADVGEVDLDAALDALDLDMNCFEDSVAFNEEPKDEEQEPDVPVFEEAVVFPPAHTKPPEEVTGINWKDRPEIYSRHFKPSPKEREELEEIAKLLEVKSGLPGSGGGGIIGNILGGSSHGESNDDPQNPQIQWNNLVSGKATNQTHNLPISIILQQGLVMYKDYDEKNQQPVAHHGCELLLLTRGFLLASRDIKYNFFGKKQDILTPLGSSLWTDVRKIETTDQQSILLKCGSTDTKDQVSLEIMPSSDLSGWRSAFQAAAIKAHLHFLPDAHDELGWQHRLCHSPWFTEAVTGEWQVDQEQGQEMTTSSSAEQGLDSLDEYNSYAPLHYATRANHTDIMRGLLEAGASPNVQDGGGKTPMYYGTQSRFVFCLRTKDDELQLILSLCLFFSSFHHA